MRGEGVCPIHGERGHPSLFLSADRGWYCYGCHRGGDAIRLYQDILGMEPLDAARRCANDFGIPVDDDYEPTLHVNARQSILVVPTHLPVCNSIQKESL